MKRIFGLVMMMAAFFVADAGSAEKTNQVSSAADQRQVPASVQKAMDQSAEINKISKQISKEEDPAVRESLLNALRTEFAKYSEQMDKADQERLAQFDAQRAELVRKMDDARAARQQRMEFFRQNVRDQKHK
jgi:hypothetical protein